MAYSIDDIVSQAIRGGVSNSQIRREKLKNLLSSTQAGLDAYRSRVNNLLERFDSGCPRNAVIVRVVLALSVQQKTQNDILSIIENTNVESGITYCELMDDFFLKFQLEQHIDLLPCTLKAMIANFEESTNKSTNDRYTWTDDPMAGSLDDLDDKPKYFH